MKIKIGDIFEVIIDEEYKKYFQMVCTDSSQLNSDVIRIFKKRHPLQSKLSVEQIIQDEIDIYAHCNIKLGLKLNFWKFFNNSEKVGLKDVLFKATNDYARKEGEAPKLVSNDWYVWLANEPYQDVGILEGKNKDAYVGLVINPLGILELLRGNEYPKNYPK